MKADDGSQKNYYDKFYNLIVGVDSSGILGYLSKYPHKLLEKPFKSNKGLNIIEVGAGQGEHLSFVTQDYSKYICTDVDGTRLSLINRHKYPKSETTLMDAESLKFADNSFDRLISTCLLSHLGNPEGALVEWRRVIRHHGNISIYISTDPSIMLRLMRLLTTQRKAKKIGYGGYQLFIAREHKISAHVLINLIKHTFEQDKINIKFRPFFLKSWYFNLLCIIKIDINKSNNRD